MRSFVGWIFDNQVATPERSRIDALKNATDITLRMRIFWNQLSAEVRAYVGEHPMDDVCAAVDLGLVDIAWMDHCPLLDDLRKDPEFAPLRERVAVRAKVVLMALRGAEATMAS